MSDDKLDSNTSDFAFLSEIENESEAEYSIQVKDRIFSEENDVAIYADKLDYQIAVFSGILTAAIDIFWVGDFSITNAQTWGRNEVNKFVLQIAQNKGYTGGELDDAIRYLEKLYRIPSDKLTPVFGGGLQHHLRDFAHHPTIIGLLLSILSQFTGKGYGTNTDGSFIVIDFPDDVHIGKTFKEKIFNGVVVWAFHLISDMAGSSQNAGKGTGIPGPVLSFLKEISILPVIRDLFVDYRNDHVKFSVIISKIFNSTYFKGIRVDLRTELGISHELSKQSLPLILNDCIVKGFFIVRRFCIEAQAKGVKSFSGLNKLEAISFIPKNRRVLTRMILISSITFNVVEKSAAFTKAAIKNKGIKNNFSKDFLLNLNFIGIAHFAIAFNDDARFKYYDLKGHFQIKANNLITQKENNISTSLSEIEVIMDFERLYEASFELLYRNVADLRNHYLRNFKGFESFNGFLFDHGDKDFRLYRSIISQSETLSYEAVERLIIEMFKRAGIIKIRDKQDGLAFILNENGKKMGIVFTRNTPLRKEYSAKRVELRKYSRIVDGIIFVILSYDKGIILEELDYYNNLEYQQNDNYIVYESIKNLFDRYFGVEEFVKFSKHLTMFNDRAKSAIGYGTVVIPSEDIILRFKEDLATFLRVYDYKSRYSMQFFEAQVEILHKNYIERSLYMAMVGDSNFADSFVSSEWFYKNYKITDYLDQTGIVTGYLKSIEQLLYAIARLSINKGKEIKMKGLDAYGEFSSNTEDNIDSTLKSLTHFFDNNEDLLEVDRYVKKYIKGTIHDWGFKQRNGYFHKDNLHDAGKIDYIREQAIYLYFLVLGGFKIDDNDYDKLGIKSAVEMKKKSREKREISYERFENWLKPLWDVGVPPETVAFSVTLFRNSRIDEQVAWSLTIVPTVRFDEVDSWWIFDSVSYQSFMPYTEFVWVLDCEWYEALETVRDLINRYLEENENSAMFKKYAAVGLSFNGRNVELVYKQ